MVADVSMDEDAKRLWRRKGRTDGKLPGFLVDGEVSLPPVSRANRCCVSGVQKADYRSCGDCSTSVYVPFPRPLR